MARKRTPRKTARVKNKSLKSYYGGLSPILIIVIVVGVLVVAGAGYFLFGKGGSGGSLMGSKGKGMGLMSQKFKESDFSYIEDELLRKHYAAQANQPKFKVVSTSSGFGGTSTAIYDMKGDSLNYRMTMADPQSDTIVIGDTTYIKDFADGKWWKQTQKPEELDTEMGDKIKEYEVDPAEEQVEYAKMKYNNLGEEACGDLMCYKYEELDPNNEDPASSGRRLFWFDTKDYLLRKDLSEFGEFSSTSEYSYDDISVEAPSPTKDVPEGKNIYEYMYSGGVNMPQGESMPSQDEIDAMMKQYQEAAGSEYPSADEFNFDSGDY